MSRAHTLPPHAAPDAGPAAARPGVRRCALPPRPAHGNGGAAPPAGEQHWPMLVLDRDDERAEGLTRTLASLCPAADAVLRATTGRQAHALLRRHAPGLVLVCGAAADPATLRAVDALHTAAPDTALVMVADDPDGVSDQGLDAALAAGAQACIALADVHTPLLLHALRHALARARTWAAYREATAAYRSVFEQSVDGIFLSAPDGRVIAANPAACEMFGYTEDELRARGRAAVVDPADPAIAAAIAERQRTGRFTGELVFRRSDGTPVPAEVSSQVFRDAEGNELTSLFVRDVSERNRARAALEASERKYRGLVQGLHDGVFVCDADDRFLEVTERLCELVGYTAGELLGMRVGELVDAGERAGDPLRRAQLARRGRLVTRRLLRRRDGGTVSVEVASMLLGDGQVECIVRDLTERERLDAGKALLDAAGQVLASSREYRQMVREVAELAVPALADWCVIDVLDDDGSPELVEVAATDPRTRALVTTALERYPHDASPERHPVGQVLHTGEPLLVTDFSARRLREIAADAGHLRLMRRLKPGSSIVVPLVAHGRILGALALTTRQGGRVYHERDVELAVELARRVGMGVEKERLHARMKEAVHAREKVLSYVAHELRNPLAGIAMNAALLLDHPLPPEQSRHSLELMLHSTDQLDRLIQDLLDAGSIQAGRLRVQPGPYEARPLVNEALEQLRPRAEVLGVRLESDLPGGLPAVHADPSRLLQVFANLVGNALKFTPREGTVTVRVRPVGAEMLFSVSDTGPGIDPAELPHLFDAFWQGKRSSGGAGLGLTIARGIVEAHGGRIWATSEPGRGSTFFFTLPYAATAAAQAPARASRAPAAEEAGAAAAPAEGAVRVLLVDDHAAVRRGVREVLAGAHGRFAVAAEAATGEDAVRIAGELHPQVVLMDLHLPGMDGIEATRRIRALPGDTRVLAITADPEETCLLNVLEAGGSGVLQKGAAHRDLLPALEIVAAGRVFLDAAGSQVLLRDVAEARRAASHHSLADLSPSERDVAILTARGFTSREIGERLHLAPKAVDAYRSHAMRKLGLAHRAELVRLVLRVGALRPD